MGKNVVGIEFSEPFLHPTAEFKKCKLLIITDTVTNKKYSFPKNKEFLDFKKFVRENDPASDFWYIHFSPLENKWCLVATVNGYVDYKLKALAKRFKVSVIH